MTPRQARLFTKLAATRNIAVELIEYTPAFSFGKRTHGVLIPAIVDVEVLLDDYCEHTGHIDHFAVDVLKSRMVVY